jgi:hypothetical protein
MKKIIMFLMLLPMFAFSQKPMMKKKMEINPEMKKKKMEIEKKKKLYQNPFDMKKKVENSIINKWEEYSRAFEYSDFEKIKTYFTYPVTLSLFGNPVFNFLFHIKWILIKFFLFFNLHFLFLHFWINFHFLLHHWFLRKCKHW